MKKMVGCLLFTFVVGVVVACTSEQEENGDMNRTKRPVDDKETYQEMIEPMHALGFSLMNEVEGNALVSPMSLYAALSMAYNGAEGETKEGIAKVLQVEGIKDRALNEANAALSSILSGRSKAIQLDIANSIWLNDRFVFQEQFAEQNKTYFDAEIASLNIDDEQAATKINNWVKQATHQKIEEVIEAPLQANFVALLLNAIYFKGDWTHAFDEALTANDTFFLKDGGKNEIPFMYMERELAYLENESFQAVKLPYGEGEMHMTVFLPNEKTDLDTLKKSLTHENWAAWQVAFRTQEGRISLPTFTLEYEIELNEFLKKTGMESAFDARANFSEMIEGDVSLAISKVKQKTYLAVNEEGTEAAAATSIEIRETAAMIESPFEMKVNRPFFIAITDEETDAILFMGTIENPSNRLNTE